MKAAGNPTGPADWPGDLLGPVSQLPPFSRLWVALSGGLDSSLLLNVVAACHPSVTALHINHQLQPNHPQTEQFCRELCCSLGVQLRVVRVTVPVKDAGAGGLEEAAREARYSVFRDLLAPGDLLLMGHHGDDQAETVLFRMLRGSGVAGLAGIPASRPLGRGALFRPWLDISRDRLQQVAEQAGLRWVEDPSNTREIYDRNYLRHRVLAELKQRWPGLLKRIAHTARACAESEQLNQALAQLHWHQCADSDRLAVARLRELAPVERRNLVRWWIRRRGFPVPPAANRDQVLSELLEAREDGAPELSGQGFAIRRYRGHLYLVPDNPSCPVAELLVPDQPLRWANWTLRLTADGDGGQSLPRIRVSTRQGGERVRPVPGGPSRTLKTWLQEESVPPWERPVLPLVWGQSDTGDELIAIGDLWCCERYSEKAGTTGWRLIIERDCD